MKPSKKKPTDSTMRNVRAANKRIKELEKVVDYLIESGNRMLERILALEIRKGKK